MRRFNLKPVFGALLFSASLTAAFMNPSVSKAADGLKLEVTVKNIKSSRGKLIALVYTSKVGFPVELEKAANQVTVAAHEGETKLTFEGLKPGECAISIIHDENDDGKLNTNFIGIPREGVGVSRDAKGSFGPPSYSDSKIKIEADTSIELHLKYL